jgi:hypothetical protein
MLSILVTHTLGVGREKLNLINNCLNSVTAPKLALSYWGGILCNDRSTIYCEYT